MKEIKSTLNLCPQYIFQKKQANWLKIQIFTVNLEILEYFLENYLLNKCDCKQVENFAMSITYAYYLAVSIKFLSFCYY